MEMLATMIAAFAVLFIRRDGLGTALTTAWVACFLISIEFTISWLPLSYVFVDLYMALMGFYFWKMNDDERGRVFGLISVLKIGLHIAISLNFGDGNWYLYALSVNSLFLLQCFVAGGWFHGMVDRVYFWRHSPHRADHALSKNGNGSAG